MSLIVDANIAHLVFGVDDDPDFGEVRRRLFNTKKPIARMVSGGKLRRELALLGDVRRHLATLDRAGRVQMVQDAVCDAKEQELIDQRVCRSDDPHIIALAQLSGVRLLCSHDGLLHADFTNPSLLTAPRGKVYQNRAHDHLLRDACKND